MRQIETSIDYFTGTMPPQIAEATFAPIVGRVLAGYAKMCAGDPKPQPKSLQGYDGWGVDKLFWGERHDGAIVSASGWAAEIAAQQPWPYIKPTRIDLQCTIWVDPAIPMDYILAIERALYELYEREPHRKRKLTWVGNNFGGRTLYVGSENSHRRIRIYDKGAESCDAHYQGAVRVEPQYRHDMAQKAYEALAGFNGDWRDRAVAMVAAEMDRVGFPLRDLGNASAPLAPTVNSRTNNDRRMRWLRDQVRPAIERLILDGYSIHEVLAALDLA